MPRREQVPDYSYLDEEPVVWGDPVDDALARKEADRELLYRHVAQILGEGHPLRCVEIVARAQLRGRESCTSEEIAAFLSQHDHWARVSNSQANRLVEVGILEVVDAEPRSYRLVDLDLTVDALRARGVELSVPRPRSRSSGLAERAL